MEAELGRLLLWARLAASTRSAFVKALAGSSAIQEGVVLPLALVLVEESKVGEAFICSNLDPV